MLTLWSIFQQTLTQFALLFGAFIVGGGILTLVSRWTNNTFRQFLYPNFGMYTFGVIGVPVHEFSHAFFCRLFLHEVKKVKWFDPKGHGGAHGSVTHLYNPWNLYHRVGHFFIGLGPVLLGPVVLLALLYFLVPPAKPLIHGIFHGGLQAFGPREFASLVSGLFKVVFQKSTFSSSWFYVFLYLAIGVSSQMELSTEDLRQAVKGIIPLLLILLLANVFAWAGGVAWHANVSRIGLSVTTVAAAIFVGAITLALANLALCALIFATINRLCGRPGINPFADESAGPL